MKFIEVTGKDSVKRYINTAHIINVVASNGGAYISQLEQKALYTMETYEQIISLIEGK